VHGYKKASQALISGIEVHLVKWLGLEKIEEKLYSKVDINAYKGAL